MLAICFHIDRTILSLSWTLFTLYITNYQVLTKLHSNNNCPLYKKILIHFPNCIWLSNDDHPYKNLLLHLLNKISGHCMIADYMYILEGFEDHL
jgi:hypothetical protein